MPNFHVTMSKMVGVRSVALTGADDRTIGRPAYWEKIKEMDTELTAPIGHLVYL